MGSEICLILHRKSANEDSVKDAIKHVRKQGIDLRVRIPWNKKEIPRVVKEAIKDGATRIIAGGGDGTINAVTNALVGKGKKPPKAVMGVMPLGTANDFANGCGLPYKDLKQCLEIACTREPRMVDVGRAGSRFFINVTSGGFGSEVTATTPVEMKKALGGGAYTIMGFVKAFKMEPYRGKLLVPGEEPFEGAMLVMAVGNNRLAGGGFAVAPKAEMDDGLLDLAMILHEPGMKLTQLAEEIQNIGDPDNKYMYYRQLPEFTLEGERKAHFNLDGEPTKKRRLTFSVLPKHLGVVF